MCDTEILERLRRLGVRIPPKDAWIQTIGWVKEKDRALHEAAVKAGEEWRAEVNQLSIQEAQASCADS